MPLALIIVAALVFLTGIKGNYAAVGAQFDTTFFGGAPTGNAAASPGFLAWFGAIFGISILFRVIGAPRAGELFLTLLILVYFIEHDSVLAEIQSAIAGLATSNSPAPAASASATPALLAPVAPAAPAAPASP